MKKDKLEKGLLYGILTIAVISLVFTFYTVLQPLKNSENTDQAKPMKSMKMSFSEFDTELAKEFMDKNHDGKCDFCGMRIEDCIASGMLQCTMDPDATIGLLGSSHIHADFKVYLDGEAVDLARPENFMKSMMMHLDNGPNLEDAGGVLHMHATGVPLWLFFKSIGMEIPSNVKFYANGKLNPEGLNYVFKDYDKLLITDSTDSSAIQQQISSITDYAKDHSKPKTTSA